MAIKGKWFTNGKENKFRRHCPDGFHEGRTIKDQSQYRHFTDGINNVFCKPEDCPEGFYPGLTTHVKRKKRSNIHAKHYTNGVINIFQEECPPGFHIGITPHKKRIRDRSSKYYNFLNIVNSNIDSFTHNYKTLSKRECAEFYGFSYTIIKSVADSLNIILSDEDKLYLKQHTAEVKRQKTIKTCLEKYNVKAPSQSVELQDKWKKEHALLYGTDSANGRAIQVLKSNVSEEYKKLLFNKDLALQFFNEHCREFTKLELCERFNCDIDSLNNFIYKFRLADFIKHETSHFEGEIMNTFPQIDFIRHCRSKLTNREIDLFSPTLNIGLEFNGDYWHSIIKIPDQNYHQNKSLLAIQENIYLIHIFEHEWLNINYREKLIKFINNIVHTEDIDISNMTINKSFSKQEINNFIDTYALESRKDYEIAYYAEKENNIIAVITFAKQNNNWIMTNMHALFDMRDSKLLQLLFQQFIDDYNPYHIIRVSNLNKFNGVECLNLNMKEIQLNPPKTIYLGLNGNIVYNEKDAKLILFDAGSKTYEWRKH